MILLGEDAENHRDARANVTFAPKCNLVKLNKHFRNKLQDGVKAIYFPKDLDDVCGLSVTKWPSNREQVLFDTRKERMIKA